MSVASTTTLRPDLVDKARSMVWHQPIDLGGGINTRPERRVQRRFARRLKLMQIPEDLSGRTVLDIGAFNGYFSFEFERRGAARVLAIDTFTWDLHGEDIFLLPHRVLRSRVEHRRLDVYDLDPRDCGTFDIVFFAGVLYHLSDPLLALQKIRSVTGRLLICETHVMIPFIHERYPLISFFPGDEENRQRGRMCANPTIQWLREALPSAGFNELDFKYTPSMRPWRKLKALVTNRPQSGRCIVHARPDGGERNTSSHKVGESPPG